MPRSRPALLAILIVLIAAGTWLTITAIDAIRLGARGSDPAIYWPAAILIVLIAAVLLYGAWAVARRVRRVLRSHQQPDPRRHSF
jgi:membrane protein implicated in regulation of membrane protease activity